MSSSETSSTICPSFIPLYLSMILNIVLSILIAFLLWMVYSLKKQSSISNIISVAGSHFTISTLPGPPPETLMMGKGKIGESNSPVEKILLDGKFYAVKVFSKYLDFDKELTIYQKLAEHRHRSIMACLYSYKRVEDDVSKFCLVMDFFKRGSLDKVLDRRQLPLEVFLTLGFTLFDALSYLHGERIYLKPWIPVAHRDVKPHNFMVYMRQTLVLGDFGLSVCQDEMIFNQVICRRGTPRYSSAEVCNGSLNVQNFDALVKTDIYSASLVIWEMMSRTILPGTHQEVADYKPAYEREVGEVNRDFDKMTNEIFVPSIRPVINPRWHTIPEIAEIVNKMQLGWSDDAMTRPSALEFANEFKLSLKLLPACIINKVSQRNF